MKPVRRVLSVFTLVLTVIFFLTACAALSAGAFTLNLAGDYVLVSDGGDKLILLQDTDTTAGSIIGTSVIDAYVDQVAFDHQYICAQQRELKENGEIDRRAAPLYCAIAVDSGEVLGPMSEAEFDQWYAALGREEPPEWISTTDQPALIARWEELNPGQSYE